VLRGNSTVVENKQWGTKRKSVGGLVGYTRCVGLGGNWGARVRFGGVKKWGGGGFVVGGVFWGGVHLRGAADQHKLVPQTKLVLGSKPPPQKS